MSEPNCSITLVHPTLMASHLVSQIPLLTITLLCAVLNFHVLRASSGVNSSNLHMKSHIREICNYSILLVIPHAACFGMVRGIAARSPFSIFRPAVCITISHIWSIFSKIFTMCLSNIRQ